MDDRLQHSARALPPLSLGNTVLIQDQQANYGKARRCTKSGVLMEVLPCSSYLFKVHGSKRMTQFNQLFLWKFTPFTAAILDTSPSLHHPTPTAAPAPTPDYRPVVAAPHPAPLSTSTTLVWPCWLLINNISLALLQTLGAINQAVPGASEENAPALSRARLQTHGGRPQEDTSLRSGLQHRPEAHGHGASHGNPF